MAIQPIRMPGARGGQALPLKLPKTPKAAISGGGRVQPKRDTTGATRGTTIPKTPAPSAVDDAMAAYRQALAQVNASVAPIDATAIRAPYAAAEATTGQLGAGYQQMVQQSGDAASQQYTTAQNEAQRAAAAFGISAGAGANPTQLQNNGSGAIALQTQANTAAAAAAGPQWQNLLEHAAAGKISDATTTRQNALDSAQMSLAGNIPSLISDEKNRRFQAKTEKFNEGLAYSQLSAKDRQYAQQYGLDALKIQQSSATATANRNATNSRSQASINASNARQDKSIAAANQRQAKSLKAAQKKATVSGIKGISQANALLKPPTSGTGAKPVIGHTVTYPSDPNGVNAGAPPLDTFVPAGQQPKPPTGYLAPLNQGKPVLGQAKKGASGSTSLANWNRAFAILKRSNPNTPPAQLMPIIGPRPKK